MAYLAVSLATTPTDAAVLAAWRARLAGHSDGDPEGEPEGDTAGAVALALQPPSAAGRA